MPLPPDADWSVFMSRYCQAGDIIIAPKLVPQTVVFVINGLFHCEILLYNSVVDVFGAVSEDFIKAL
jgi:hypothetical protein